jgi:hypothetical protein
VKELNIREEPGWVGGFTRDQADGALYPNGSRIRKNKGEPKDGTPTGTNGTVLGSIRVPGESPAYFVEWDNRPRVAVFIVEWKLALSMSKAMGG